METSSRQGILERTDARPAQLQSRTRRTLILANDLPGPLSMRWLHELGIVIPLDEGSAFLSDDAGSLYGRATVASALVPTGSAACTLLAAWIWTGGPFPETIDIVSQSHYRAPVHGHLIRVHNRNIPPDHLMRMGRLWVTSPQRTACDLACDDGHGGPELLRIISAVLHQHQLTPSACLHLLASNPRWPGHARGVALFNAMKHDFDS
ncbi:hypothetical protein [Bifidobacterium psychraerophilum]|nr:hypothetical protein [Bifidobacterium psychraerophilum]PKA94183.1 hypothetical protein A9A89_0362 [Bifidobacterium psychraerophilum DSM 22366]